MTRRLMGTGFAGRWFSTTPYATPRARHAPFLVLVLLGLPVLSGCTVIGLIADGERMKDRVYDTADLMTLPTGDTVQVHRRSGAVVSGSLVGYEELPEAAYAAAYAGLWEDAAVLPLGARVHVDATVGKDVTGTFQGFVGLPPYLSVRVDEDPADARPTRTVPFKLIDVLDDAGGTAYDRAALDVLVAANRLPTRSTLVLATASQEERIPIQEVHHVVRPGRKNAGAGAAIGLALDLTVILLLALTYEPPSICLSDCAP